MLIKEINSIGEKEFFTYSLNQTKDVFETLEKINWSDIKDKNLEENVDFYSSLLDVVYDRVSSNHFPELSDNSEEKSYLLLRLLRIRTSISQYRLFFLRDDVSENVKKLSTETEKSINQHLRESEKDFEDKLEKKIKDVANTIEPQLITTVLTLMGVFSAIITIIMSIVVTSSSWLNNADGASAVLAFIIPNFVVISAIVVLLGMVFRKRQPEIVVISRNSWDQPNVADKALKKASVLHWVTISVFFLIALVIGAFSLYEIRTTTEPHMRYILSQGMYEVQASENVPKVVMIEFQIDGKIYEIPYKEEYFHDGKLYFCEEHRQLE